MMLLPKPIKVVNQNSKTQARQKVWDQVRRYALDLDLGVNLAWIQTRVQIEDQTREDIRDIRYTPNWYRN